MKSSFSRYLLVGVILFLTFLNSAHALYYDFEKDEQGWQQVNGTCKAEKGEYIVTGSDGVGVLPDSDWKNDWVEYTVQCDSKMEQGPDNMSILVRYQKSDTYYIFAVMNGRQRAEIWSRVNGNYTDEKDIQFPNELNKVYKLKVEATKKNEFKFYIDDKLIAEWSDNKISSGKVGVRTYSSISHFDNIIITGAGIPKSKGEPGAVVEPAFKLTATWGNIKSQLQ